MTDEQYEGILTDALFIQMCEVRLWRLLHKRLPDGAKLEVRGADTSLKRFSSDSWSSNKPLMSLRFVVCVSLFAKSRENRKEFSDSIHSFFQAVMKSSHWSVVPEERTCPAEARCFFFDWFWGCWGSGSDWNGEEYEKSAHPFSLEMSDGGGFVRTEPPDDELRRFCESVLWTETKNCETAEGRRIQRSRPCVEPGRRGQGGRGAGRDKKKEADSELAEILRCWQSEEARQEERDREDEADEMLDSRPVQPDCPIAPRLPAELQPQTQKKLHSDEVDKLIVEVPAASVEHSTENQSTSLSFHFPLTALPSDGEEEEKEWDSDAETPPSESPRAARIPAFRVRMPNSALTNSAQESKSSQTTQEKGQQRRRGSKRHGKRGGRGRGGGTDKLKKLDSEFLGIPSHEVEEAGQGEEDAKSGEEEMLWSCMVNSHCHASNCLLAEPKPKFAKESRSDDPHKGHPQLSAGSLAHSTNYSPTFPDTQSESAHSTVTPSCVFFSHLRALSRDLGKPTHSPSSTTHPPILPREPLNTQAASPSAPMTSVLSSHDP
uniref:Uncharacterized protein n=1 Tax=Chromera velia CCMP2878 TaxID=1169474 RepID=A0A0G4F3Y9_9ALVE|eukprot:Cvel_15035.t1-p1 / transcript=Cvel_15035.t1 / gene=Cvel_15035 / organism=Chromera_velia_CCMP2878 / gene_product=hypothetical protein / transcript_product=hypothetical protein / location=Cvel_scaffold1094:50467-53969(-) / protein_length=546 / sequence_SO=supercontig / SO=protein_coding / is_pseudo=false